MKKDIPLIRPIMKRHENNNDAIPLRDTHPQLFKSLLLKGIVLALIAVAIFVVPEAIVDSGVRSNDSTIPFWFWGVAFLAISMTLFYGISNGSKRYQWARRALIAGAIITGIWAVGYIFALMNPETIRPFGTIFWVYMSANFIIWAGEPAFNPLSSALSEHQPIEDSEYDLR